MSEITDVIEKENMRIESYNTITCKRCGYMNAEINKFLIVEKDGNSYVRCPRCKEVGWGGIKTFNYLVVGKNVIPVIC